MLTDRSARSRSKYHRLRYDRKTPLITRVTRVALLIKRRGKRGPLLRINHGARVSARDCIVYARFESIQRLSNWLNG